MFLLQVWTDWKTTIRKKIAHNKAAVRATGGGEYRCQMLSVMMISESTTYKSSKMQNATKLKNNMLEIKQKQLELQIKKNA